jgi:hypothetical protein
LSFLATQNTKQIALAVLAGTKLPRLILNTNDGSLRIDAGTRKHDVNTEADEAVLRFLGYSNFSTSQVYVK